MTKFICEIGSNHNQNLDRCFEIIEIAKQIGFWGVKFQYFKANTLYRPEMKKEIESMKKKELPFRITPYFGIKHLKIYKNLPFSSVFILIFLSPFLSISLYIFIVPFS